MKTRIFFDGQEYASVEAMPEEIRQEYQQALAQLADADGNGIPDILERENGGKAIGVYHSSITVNGRTFEGVGDMPAAVRCLYDRAMGHRADASPLDYTDGRKRVLATVNRIDHALDRFLRAFLLIVAVVVMAGAIFLMLQIDGGPRGQGGRWYVAIVALLALGALDTQYRRLVWRRTFFDLIESSSRWHYRLGSSLLLLAAAAILFGLAWLLP